MPAQPRILTWLHFGDLHLTNAAESNFADFQALIESANRHLAGYVDFALLPGDNADQGTPSQFRLVRQGIDAMSIPVHILPGDHDFHPGTLNAFYSVLGAAHLPSSFRIGNMGCIFPDVVSAGTGGPDFRPAASIAHAWATIDGGAAITLTADPADNADRHGNYVPPQRQRDGSDRDSIGAWPEKHLLGTQLGPNRNGRTW